MAATHRIYKVRRKYNQWVADQTLEDYALRFTAHKGRQQSISRVGNTALGASAFLALEGIAAAVTLNYGFVNTVTAMVVVCVLFFITGFPITYYSAKHGLDIDLLTRGAGFGYLGSTITSLIYASFTFIFFAIEAAILASALKALFGIPIFIGYFLCAVAVIPIVTHGISAISRFQSSTQWIWLVLQVAAVAIVIGYEFEQLGDWASFEPHPQSTGGFDLLLFGAAASVFFALVAQIGEQVDYLRFMPPKTEENKKQWWFWLIVAGPGWVFMGLLKMLLGSFMAYIALTAGSSSLEASDPVYMYQKIFGYVTQSPSMALVLAAVMVIICQMKINVTNAYAGSIAWSNFFSRLTHSHPGRVVWLVFNVTIALLLMELGIYQALEAILGIFAIVAVSWLGSLAADLMVNKPLGLSPSVIEFKRAHLYDINPVGLGSMLLATAVGLISYLGFAGEAAKTLCHFISLATCFVAVPLIAIATKGRYYLARQSPQLIPLISEQSQHPLATSLYHRPSLVCGICENEFESEDMSYCTAYALPICSLCCSLDARCLDSCKPHAKASNQFLDQLSAYFSPRVVKWMSSRFARFLGLLVIVNSLNAALLAVIYRHMSPSTEGELVLLNTTMLTLFFTLLIASGVVSWLFLLAHESRVVAQQESNRQTEKLTQEIEAHQITDMALQAAKEHAEHASAAKTRYMTGMSHELRTPLQSVLGYAQLLGDKPDMPDKYKNGLGIIHRSGQYLSDLIEGLLDISKIEAGRLELLRGSVQLPVLIEQLSAMFAMQAKQRGIGFECRVTDTLPDYVTADEKRLRQVLINLLSNAIKYTPSGQVVFEVKYRNQVAEFSITDTGLGIEPQHLERIFEPFERIRSTDNAHLPGTGLGLTIVKLLTEIMGGDLRVESQPKQGSRFTVSLMLPWVNSPTDNDKEQVAMTGYEGDQKTLCIVDDDPVLRGLLVDLFAPLGFNTLEAHNAQACLSLLSSAQPDLFLLDISMPGMSGLTLAKTLREQGVQEKIVMLSANAHEYEELKPSRPLAFDDYLVKPVSNRELLDKVAKHLDITWKTAAVPEITVSEVNSVMHQAADGLAVKAPNLSDTSQRWPVANSPEVRELLAMAEMGYRKGVDAALAQMAQTGSVPEACLAHLQHLHKTFQYTLMADSLDVADE